MDKKSKIFLWVFFLLIVGSVGVTFWRIMIKKDYIIEAHADCDPAVENCFIQECDSSAGECTGNPEEDTSFYKLIKRNASNIPLCDPADENCKALTCPEGEKDCQEILCDDTTKAQQGVECNDPVQYASDHHEEESESSECAEDDEKCLASEAAENCAEGDEECLAAAQSKESACDPASEECAVDQKAAASDEQGAEAGDDEETEKPASAKK